VSRTAGRSSVVSIKLCGVRTVSDALLCVTAGADKLGVVFAKSSKRCVSIEQARAIHESLPDGLPLIGVFQDASLDDIEAAARGARLSAVQLHGALAPALFSPDFLARLAVPIHRALQISGPESLAQLDALATPETSDRVARVLLDGPRGGSGAAFPWHLLGEARARYAGKLDLAGGLNPGNVAEAIRIALPDGVDVSSGIEGPDGFKDRAKVRAFVRAARAAAVELTRG